MPRTHQLMTALRPVDLIPIVPGLEHLIPLIEPWLVKACAHDAEWDLAEIGQGVRDGKFQLWACWDSEAKKVRGAGVTRVSINKRNEKIGHDVVFAGEDMGKLLPLLDRLKEFFRAQGCVRWRLSGRKGWAKKLPHMRLAAIVLEESLA
jgi:hypothetical protein